MRAMPSHCRMAAGSESLDAVEARSAPLLQSLSNLRRSKTAPGGARCPKVGQPQTASECLGAAIGRPGRQPTSGAVGCSPNRGLLVRSARAVSKWSPESGPDFFFQYPLPGGSSASVVGKNAPSTPSDQQHRTSFGASLHHSETPIAKGDGDPSVDDEDPCFEDSLTKMSLSAVVNRLGETNLTSFAAADILKNLKSLEGSLGANRDDLPSCFTDRYFKACDCYSKLVDQVRDVCRDIEILDQGTGDGLLNTEGIICHGDKSKEFASEKFGTEKIPPTMHCIGTERLQLVTRLKQMACGLDSFSWEAIASDFRRWVQSTEVSGAAVKELLEQIAEQEHEVLTLLSLSRYFIEESLGSHLLRNATTLTDFHDRVFDHIARIEGMKGECWKDENGVRISFLNAPRMLMVRHRMAQLAEDQERYSRQLEVNRSLFHHMVSATLSSGEANIGKDLMTPDFFDLSTSHFASMCDVSPLCRDTHKGKTVVKLTGGSTPKPAAMKKHGLLASHSGPSSQVSLVDYAFGQCLLHGKTALDMIIAMGSKAEVLMQQARRAAMKKRREAAGSIAARFVYLGSDAKVARLKRRRGELEEKLNQAKVDVRLENVFGVALSDSNHQTLERLMAMVNGEKVSSRAIADDQQEQPLKPIMEQEVEPCKVARSSTWIEQRRNAIVPGKDDSALQDLVQKLGAEKCGAGSCGRSLLHQCDQTGGSARRLVNNKQAEIEKLVVETELILCKLRSKAEDTAIAINEKYESGSWLFHRPTLEVFMVLNPRTYVLEAFRECIDSLLELSCDSYCQEELAEFRRAVTVMGSEFQKEKIVRLQAVSQLCPFKQSEWIANTDLALDNFLVEFQAWYCDAKDRGLFPDQAAVAQVDGTCSKPLVSEFDEELRSLKSEVEEFQESLRTMSCKLTTEKAETVRLKEEKQMYKNAQSKLDDLAEAEIHSKQTQDMVVKVMDQIKAVMTERKNLSVSAMRVMVGLTSADAAGKLPPLSGGPRRKRQAAGMDEATPTTNTRGRKFRSSDRSGSAKRAPANQSTTKALQPMETAADCTDEAATRDTGNSIDGRGDADSGDDFATHDGVNANAGHGSIAAGHYQDTVARADAWHSGDGVIVKSLGRQALPQERPKDPLSSNELDAKGCIVDAAPTDNASWVDDALGDDSCTVPTAAEERAGQTVCTSVELGGHAGYRHLVTDQTADGPGTVDAGRTTAARQDILGLFSESVGQKAIQGSVSTFPEALGSYTEIFEEDEKHHRAGATVQGTTAVQADCSTRKSARPSALANSAGVKSGRVAAHTLSDIDKTKIDHHIDSAKAKGTVLMMRSERKRVELARLCAKLMPSTAKSEVHASTIVQAKPCVQPQPHEKQMLELRHQLKTAEKMHNLWRNRFCMWHEELTEKFGDTIMEDLAEMKERNAAAPSRTSAYAQQHGGLDPAWQLQGQALHPQGKSKAQRTHAFQNPMCEDCWALMHETRIDKCFADASWALDFNIHISKKKQMWQSYEKIKRCQKGRGKGKAAIRLGLHNLDAIGSGYIGRKAVTTFAGGFSINRDRALARAVQAPTMSLLDLIKGFQISKNFLGHVSDIPRRAPTPLRMRWASGGSTAGKAEVLSLFNQAPIMGRFGGFRPKYRRRLPKPRLGKVENPMELPSRVAEGGLLAKLSLGEPDGEWSEIKGGFRVSPTKIKPRGESLKTLRRAAKCDLMLKPSRGFDASTTNKLEEKSLPSRRPSRARSRTHKLRDSPNYDNSTSTRLQELRQSGRRRTFTDRELHSNVGILRMFMDDVKDDIKRVRSHSVDFAFARDTATDDSAPLPTKLSPFGKPRVSISAHPPLATNLSPKLPSDSDSSSSSSSSTASGLPDTGITASAKCMHRHMTTNPDDAIWGVKTDPLQHTLSKLKSCRDKLVQRFGGVDRAYVKSIPVMLAMSEELFAQVVRMMGFSEDDAAQMFQLMATLVPVSRRTKHTGSSTIVKGQQATSVGGHGQASLSRSDFSEALRCLNPVRNLAQLRMRILKKYKNLEAAFKACDITQSGAVSAVTYRDFLAGMGIAATDAWTLFMQMLEHNENEAALGAPLETTRSAFIKSLRHAEGVIVAERLCQALARALAANDYVVSHSASRYSVDTIARTGPRKRCSIAPLSNEADPPSVVESKRTSVSIPLTPHGDDREGTAGDVGAVPLATEACLDGVGRRNSEHAIATEIGTQSTESHRISVERQTSQGHRTSTGEIAAYAVSPEPTQYQVSLSTGRRGSSGWAIEGVINAQGEEKDKSLYNAFIFSLGSKVPATELLTLDEFRTVMVPLKLPPEDVAALFRLADHPDNLHASIQEVALRMFGGLGHRYSKLRESLGLKSSTAAIATKSTTTGRRKSLRTHLAKPVNPNNLPSFEIRGGCSDSKETAAPRGRLDRTDRPMGYYSGVYRGRIRSGRLESAPMDASRSSAPQGDPLVALAVGMKRDFALANAATKVPSHRKLQSRGRMAYPRGISAATKIAFKNFSDCPIAASTLEAPSGAEAGPEENDAGDDDAEVSSDAPATAGKEDLRAKKEASCNSSSEYRSGGTGDGADDSEDLVEEQLERKQARVMFREAMMAEYDHAEDKLAHVRRLITLPLGGASAEGARGKSILRRPSQIKMSVDDIPPFAARRKSGAFQPDQTGIVRRKITASVEEDLSPLRRNTGVLVLDEPSSPGPDRRKTTGFPAGELSMPSSVRRKSGAFMVNEPSSPGSPRCKSLTFVTDEHYPPSDSSANQLDEIIDKMPPKRNRTGSEWNTSRIYKGIRGIKTLPNRSTRVNEAIKDVMMRSRQVMEGHNITKGGGQDKEVDTKEVGLDLPLLAEQNVAVPTAKCLQGKVLHKRASAQSERRALHPSNLNGLEINTGSGSTAEVWDFQDNEDDEGSEESPQSQAAACATSPMLCEGTFPPGKGTNPVGSEGIEDECGTSPALAHDYAAEAQGLGRVESCEKEKNLRRLKLFDGDAIELEIAMVKLQEFRKILLSKGKGPWKAFVELADSDLKLGLPALHDRLVRVYKFNSLDSERVLAVVTTLTSSTSLSYLEFLLLLRFAAPVSSLIEFRSRLVERYGTMDTATRVLGICAEEELSIDLFEQKLLGAGFVSKDARRLFRAIDGIQREGPHSFVNLGAFRFAVDHAHVLAWLDVLQARLGGRAAAHSALANVSQTVGGLDKALHSADQLERALGHLGVPLEFARPIFALLDRRTPGNATLGDLVHMMHMSCDDTGGPVPHHPRTCASSRLPAEAVRDAALEMATRLQRHVRRTFTNYHEAYHALGPAQPAIGVTLDEWMEAMGAFGFDVSESWANVFGHIVEWQHHRWDATYRGVEVRMSLAKFATALSGAAPCQSLPVLRKRLHDRCQTLHKAWIQLTGKEGVEEIGLAQWQRGLHQISIGICDSNRLFAVLRAIPGVKHCADHQSLSRSAFICSLGEKSVEANSRLLDFLLRVFRERGVVSRAFEGLYPLEPLQLDSFLKHTVPLLQASAQDLSLFFVHLDVHRAGVSIHELLDTLTTFQALYLPYSTDRPSETALMVAQHAAEGGVISPMHTSELAMSPTASLYTGVQRSLARARMMLALKEGASPAGILTGSTTIPDTDSERPCTSENEAVEAQRPKTSPNVAVVQAALSLSAQPHKTSGNRRRRSLFHLSGQITGQMPMPDLAGWHLQESRPQTSPEAFSMRGVGRRKSLNGSSRKSAPRGTPPPGSPAFPRLSPISKQVAEIQEETAILLNSDCSPKSLLSEDGFTSSSSASPRSKRFHGNASAGWSKFSGTEEEHQLHLPLISSTVVLNRAAQNRNLTKVGGYSPPRPVGTGAKAPILRGVTMATSRIAGALGDIAPGALDDDGAASVGLCIARTQPLQPSLACVNPPSPRAKRSSNIDPHSPGAGPSTAACSRRSTVSANAASAAAAALIAGQ